MRDATAMVRLSAIASKQFGVVTRDDATRCGLTPGQLRRLVENGVLDRLAPRVFRFAASDRSWHQEVLAAVFDGGPECHASHRTAGALHVYDGFEPDVIEVVVPMHIFHRRKNVIVHHTRDLPAVDRTRIGPIRVTSRARTLIDLGAVTSADRVEEALDGAERDGRIRRRQLEQRYNALRAPGRNGVGAMTQILGARVDPGGLPQSVLERRLLRLLRRARLAEPTVNHPVRLHDGKKYVLDFAYPDRLLAIEVDGHGTHATRRQRAGDNARINALEDAGWSVRRFTYEQVTNDPEGVVAAIRTALARNPSVFDENSSRHA
jgi:very-short-patch-repair endonuclease